MTSTQQGHWGKFADCAQAVGVHAGKAGPSMERFYGAGLALLRKSERFYLPNGADIMQEKEISPLKPFLKSPYGVVSILHEITLRDAPPGWSDKAWSIAMAVRDKGDLMSPAARAGIPAESVLLFSFNQVVVEGRARWAMSPYSCLLRLDIEPGMKMFLGDGPGARTMLSAGMTEDYLISEFAEDAQAWMNLCLLCNVQNTERVRINPPEKLNKARLKSGKEGFQSYHVLEIGGERWDSPYVTEGTGSGKRSHLRRGHIRHLQDGRLTWVRDAIVKGSKAGFVHKDYVVKP